MTSPGHAFISYVREDSDAVDSIIATLTAANIPVWRDKDGLFPGQDWQVVIRKAIQDGALVFVACFSSSSAGRDRSYQNEELALAVEQFRQVTPGRVWLIPVRLDDCELPDFNLGAGRTLASLQRVDLFGEARELGLARLIASCLAILQDADPDPAQVRAAVSEAVASQRGELLSNALKKTLLESSKQIEARDLVSGEVKSLIESLRDADRFPQSHNPVDQNEEVRSLVGQAHRYMEAAAPLVHASVVGGAYGRPEHRRMWSRAVEAAAQPAFQTMSGASDLLNLRRLPALPILYAGALAAWENENWESLRAFVLDPQVQAEGGSGPFIGTAHPGLVFRNAEIAETVFARELLGEDVDDQALNQYRARGGLRLTAMSDVLHHSLRSHFEYELPTDAAYDIAFDRLEIFLALVAEDIYRTQEEAGLRTGPYMYGGWTGRFTWRDRYAHVPIEEVFVTEARSKGDDWEPLKVGFFDGKLSRVEAAYQGVSGRASDARRKHR